MQIIGLRQDGVSQEEIEQSIYNVCKGNGLTDMETKARWDEAIYIQNRVQNLLATPGPTPSPTPKPPTEDREQPPAWLQTLMAAIGQRNPEEPRAEKTPKRRRIPDPARFNGSRAEYPGWRLCMRGKIEGDLADFPSEKLACDYIYNYLERKAARIATLYMQARD
jgi:hypothetical protein